MINIRRVNYVLAMINRINFMVADIVKQIGDYTILTQIGEYIPISEDSKYTITEDKVIVYTQCVIGKTKNGSWIRDETVELERSLFDPMIPLQDRYNSIFKKRLSNIKDEIVKKKERVKKEYDDILGAEYLIESYIRRGLSIENR